MLKKALYQAISGRYKRKAKGFNLFSSLSVMRAYWYKIQPRIRVVY